MYVPAKIIIPGDAATTAANIISYEFLFRLGIVGSLVTQLFYIAVVLLLYVLFKQVNKNHAMLMVVLSLVAVPIAMLNTLNRLAALVLVKGDYLVSLGAEQVNTLVMFFLDLNAQGVLIATIFWSLWLFPLGYLVYKSGYFPKFIGILLFIAGAGYLLDPIVNFIIPSAKAFFIPVLNVMTMGELLYMFWFVFKGVKLPINKINAK
jgi:hypothetical protein